MGGGGATLWLPWLEKWGGGDVSIQGGSEISPKSLRSQGVTDVMVRVEGDTRDRQIRGPAVLGSPGRAGVTATEPGPESHRGPG